MLRKACVNEINSMETVLLDGTVVRFAGNNPVFMVAFYLWVMTMKFGKSYIFHQSRYFPAVDGEATSLAPQTSGFSTLVFHSTNLFCCRLWTIFLESRLMFYQRNLSKTHCERNNCCTTDLFLWHAVMDMYSLVAGKLCLFVVIHSSFRFFVVVVARIWHISLWRFWSGLTISSNALVRLSLWCETNNGDWTLPC